MVEPISNEVKQLGQESKLEAILIGTISRGTWSPGDRLPAERQLATEMGVSRNTLRGVLRRLEARGMIDIRKGSGCYLIALEPKSPTEKQPANDSLAALMARFEASYLCLPELVALAAQRIDPMTLRTLESAVTDIGRAVVERDMDDIKNKTRDFFRIIGDSTGNPVITEVVRSLHASASVMFPRFFSFGEAERSQMFGDFVHILRALQAGDPRAAREATQRKIINTARAFAALRKVPLSPVIRAAMASDTPEGAA
ncbi:MAG: FadR family transcriptional regulator [Rhodobacterales bacterium]|nr:FadR family transcriptional regulator [Rhodobacterales bacterium]